MAGPMLIDGGGRFAFRKPEEVPPREPPPARPTQQGLEPGHVEQNRENDFSYGVEGPTPFAVGGNDGQRHEQLAWTATLGLLALQSYATGHTPVTLREPSDMEVMALLTTLDPIPPLGADGADGEDITHAVYQSVIPNATAEDGYNHFVENPGEVFGAAGLEIRPSTVQLENGGRYMLELGTPIPTWLPVEITLDPQNHAVTITTLDGHLLRGEQTFTFTDNGDGSTTLTQDARFQAGSTLVGEAQQLASIADGQHASWEEAHYEIFAQFNGDPDYKGIGTDFSVGNLVDVWTPILIDLAKDPGQLSDAVVDVAGSVADAGIDITGRGIEEAFDWLGIPGGGVIAQGFDTVGDVASTVADVTGDVAHVGTNVVFAPVIGTAHLLDFIFGGSGDGGEGLPPDTGTTTSTSAPPTTIVVDPPTTADTATETGTTTATTTSTSAPPTTTTVPGG